MRRHGKLRWSVGERVVLRDPWRIFPQGSFRPPHLYWLWYIPSSPRGMATRFGAYTTPDGNKLLPQQTNHGSDPYTSEGCPRLRKRRVSILAAMKPIRQITIMDFGHEEPTLLLTNQLKRGAAKLVTRYAQRMLIENGIFFHMDAVAMKVNCDLQLILMGGSLYRLLGRQLGNGYENAKSRRLFRDFIDATAAVRIGESDIQVRFQKRAHNPLLAAARHGRTDLPVPWPGNKRLRLTLG